MKCISTWNGASIIKAIWMEFIMRNGLQVDVFFATSWVRAAGRYDDGEDDDDDDEQRKAEFSSF